MKKKSLLKRVLKKVNKKPELEVQQPSSPGKFKPFILKHKARIKSFFKKVFASKKLKEMKTFFVVIAGYGFILNYSLCFIFGVKFTLFTLFAWGIAYYFINQELVEWIRRIIAKR